MAIGTFPFTLIFLRLLFSTLAHTTKKVNGRRQIQSGMLKTASARFISNIMASLTNAIDIVSTSVINMQLKTDIPNEAVNSVSVAVPSDEVIDILDEPSDPPLPADFNMLDALLNNIDENYTINDATPDDQDTADAAKTLCENELYQLLLGNVFKMKMRNTETQVYNCPLSWWKLSAHRFKHFEGLAVKYLAIPATSAPSERIWSRAARVLTVKRNRMSEEVTSAIMYCRENRELLHKYYEEMAKERMHCDDYHLIEKHKALLPTFEHEKDAESKIDVGVDEDKEW